ncbi:YciI family protein [Phaeobacter sp. A36a-5a]|uniref:YciI family protein n=1 Tax=Phaeobacter bryozoorum TaxID=1086632 RepID=UPI0030C99D49
MGDYKGSRSSRATSNHLFSEIHAGIVGFALARAFLQHVISALEKTMIYAITIYGEAGLFETLPKERQDEVLAGHGALQEALKKRGEFISIKLMPPTSAVMLDPAPVVDHPPLIVDGPYAETKESFLGFYAADFENLDDALTHAKMISSPVVRLEVRPVAWAGGAISSE